MAEAEKKPSTLAAATGRWRDKLLDAAVITIPTALINQAVSAVQGEFFAQPWQILWVALPIAICAFIAWRLLRKPTAQRLDWRFGVFLGCYARCSRWRAPATCSCGNARPLRRANRIAAGCCP